MTIEELVRRQKDAFLNGVNRSADARRQNLTQLRELVAGHADRLCDAMNRDLGKPPVEAHATDIATVLLEIDYHLKHFEKWMEPGSPGESVYTFPSKSRIYRQPLGSVLIIGPWNFPVHLSLMPLIGALSAGNTAVVKPSELAPATSAEIRSLIASRFEPEEVAVVEGGEETAAELLRQPFDKIFFTGSPRVGRIVMKAAARHLTPVTLELGGKSPAIVHSDAQMDVGVRRIWWGKTINAGQTCIAPDFAAVHESQREAFIHESEKTLAGFFPDGCRPGENFTRIVNDEHFDRLTGLLEDADVLLGGRTDPQERLIEPTLIAAGWEDEVMDEEIFGPILPLLTYADDTEIIGRLTALNPPLSLYLFARDEAFRESIIREVPFGNGCINDTILQIVNPKLPFGGAGASGIGSYHGWYSFDTFSRRQSVLDKALWPDPEVRYPPHSDGKLKWLKRLF
jgi:aldehyde dehydrogenase (NAD+)